MADNTITLKGNPVRLEGTASGAITPGFLLEQTSATVDTFVAHNSAGANAEKMFALENELQGDGPSTAYSNADRVQVGIFRNGDEVLAYLAVGETATKGQFLESNGDGYLKVHAASSAGVVEYPQAIVGVATETIDASSAAARIEIRIV